MQVAESMGIFFIVREKGEVSGTLKTDTMWETYTSSDGEKHGGNPL